MSSILVVDDDPVLGKSLVALGKREGHAVDVAGSIQDARRRLSHQSYDLMLLDLELPDGNGLELQQEIAGASNMRVVIVTAHPTLDSAMAAANGSVAGYLQKPLEPQAWKQLMATLAPAPCGIQPGGLLGQSRAIRDVIQMLTRIAPTDARVLVTGESGTGKELAAQTLHQASGRSGPFIALNCGAVAPDLLASQLFGHEKGSFTGALTRHCGVFEQAAGGTLLLDEIGEMPASLQVFLLRVLETGTVVRVGGITPIPISARIVAATNRDLSSAMQQGELRADLFYRLADVQVQMPSLRERGDDVILLANIFIEQLNQRYAGHKFLAPSSAPALRAHKWPGNVRELASLVQESYLLQDGPALELVPHQLQTEQAVPENCMVFDVGTPLEVIKRNVLARTLQHLGGDKTAAARVLGISVRTVHNELARLRGS